MTGGPARWYALASGVFLLLQGASTLAARLVPAIDRALPQLLATTQMVPSHSALHILTALIAFTALKFGPRATWWFAMLFGLFYSALGIIGLERGAHLGLGLQPFDHPFHILLGLLGIVAAWAGVGRTRHARDTGGGHP